MDDDVDDGDARIVICRDLPGEHLGGPDCWCCPMVLRPDDLLAFFIEAADQPYKQVN